MRQFKFMITVSADNQSYAIDKMEIEANPADVDLALEVLKDLDINDSHTEQAIDNNTALALAMGHITG